ncbi:MAG TPA: type II toxin-antitoxin system VapC family toxin [Thermoanaerobaculia bacterium]
MRGVDTNVLLRPFAQDDPGQVAAVETLFRELEAQGERLFVSCIVLCEACWSLRGLGFPRSKIAATLEKLLDTAFFEIQDRELVRRALAQYRQGPAGFADYLIGWQNRQAGCADTVTFDGDLEGTPGFSLLSSSSV